MTKDKDGIPVCKCGQTMQAINRAWLPGASDYYWTCLLRKWGNFWKHDAPLAVDKGVELK